MNDVFDAMVTCIFKNIVATFKILRLNQIKNSTKSLI